MTSSSATDLQSFRDLALRFARKELEPKAIEADNYPFCGFNRDILTAARGMGLLHVLLPEDRGGTGQGMGALSEILLSLAQSDAGFAAVVFVNSLAQSALTSWGSQALAAAAARSGLLSFPAYDLPTDLPGGLGAERQGDGWSLTGRVDYLALAPVADAMILPARIRETGLTAFFLVETAARGVSMSEPVLSLGLRSCPVSDAALEGVEVPAGHLLCADAGSAYPALAARFRPAAAALAVGVLTGSFEAAAAYAKDRYQGGRMIIEHDQVRLMLANMAVIAETGRTLVRAMAQASDGGHPSPLSDAGLILLTEQASRAATDGVQCLGGYGYMQDYGQEKRMRDAKQIESIFGSAPLKRLDFLADVLRDGIYPGPL